MSGRDLATNFPKTLLSGHSHARLIASIMAVNACGSLVPAMDNNGARNLDAAIPAVWVELNETTGIRKPVPAKPAGQTAPVINRGGCRC
jgi:hypothetical protein